MNRRDFMRAAALAGLFCTAPAIAAESSEQKKEVVPPFVKWTVGPYLQNPSATAMTICFVSDHAQDVSAVVKNASEVDRVSHSATATPIPGTSATMWKVRLTDLKGGTEYRYNLEYKVDDKPVVEKQYHFKTPASDTDTMRCILLNDVHNRTGTAEAVMKHVAADDYEFTILLGDCWTDPSWNGDGRKIMTTLAELVRVLNGAEKPILYVRGNHECRGYFSGKMGYLFDLPGLDPAASYYEQNFHFSYPAGPVWFLFNDAGEDGDKRKDKFEPYRQRQSKWIESEIKKPEYRAAKYHIFASHIPLYNVNYWSAKYCRGFWSPVLAEADIDLALGAHDHQWRVLEKDCICVNDKCENYNKAGTGQKRCPHSPPYPLVIGGGPSLKQGTVMVLKADSKKVSLRMLNTAGKTLVQSEVR
ncbi:MAG: FN3 domain-containing metallophosphoesterase family protein [Planctomycetota bacterium]